MADWAWNKDGKLVCRSGFASPVNGLGREAVSKYGHLGYFHKGGHAHEGTGARVPEAQVYPSVEYSFTLHQTRRLYEPDAAANKVITQFNVYGAPSRWQTRNWRD